jgi:hypothetical protein
MEQLDAKKGEGLEVWVVRATVAILYSALTTYLAVVAKAIIAR